MPFRALLLMLVRRTARVGLLVVLVLGALVALVPGAREIAFAAAGAWPAGATPGAVARADAAPGRVDDRAGLIPPGDHERMNWYLGQIERETGIDVRLVFAAPPQGETIERFAAAEAERLGIGRANGGLRGLLFVYDPASERLRVEVGYGLEEYFPDAFLGHLIERHAHTFFRAGDPTTGLRLMIRILHERTRDQMLGGRFDAAPLLRRENAAHVSGGGGASAAARLDDRGIAAFREPEQGFRVVLEPAAKRFFGAQPTPDATFRRYLDWLADGRFDPRVELFTSASQNYLDGLPLTRPYLDHILLLISAKQYRIVERGDLAMLYFTSTPLVSPMFLRKAAAGWQMDLIEEVGGSREIAGGQLTWTLTGAGESGARFADLFVDLGGYLRVAEGDNRPLPIPGGDPAQLAAVGRELPATLLTEPAIPALDEFGEPAMTADKLEIIALLRARRYAELERTLSGLHRRASAEIAYERHVREAYFAFDRADADLETLLEEWATLRPASVEARLARGQYYLARAWASRGTKFIRETPRENIQQMRTYAQLAAENLSDALARDPRQTIGYGILLRVIQLSGDDEMAREVLRRGLEVSPASYVLRIDRMPQLWPKWGGSVREMEEFAREADAFVPQNPRLRTLHGAAARARGDALEREKDWPGAIREYTRALEFGENVAARLERGQAYYRSKEYERALEDLHLAWMQLPQDPEVLDWRGRTYYRLAAAAVPAQRGLLLERAMRDMTLAHQVQPEEGRAEWIARIGRCQQQPTACR